MRAVSSPTSARVRAPDANAFWCIYGSQNTPRGSVFHLPP